MFDWLFSFGSDNGASRSDDSTTSNQLSGPNTELPKETPEQASNTSPSTSTYVYVWRLTSEKVGHVAVQVGGDKPKENESDPGEYLSLHPGVVPAVGFMAVLPLPATTATTLNEDKMNEGAAGSQQIAADSGSNTVPQTRHEEKMAAPDEVYKLEGLNQAAMLAEIALIRENIEEGNQAYQLLPKVNVSGFLNDAPYFVSQDPIDILVASKNQLLSNQTEKMVDADNCATIASKIINAGGGHIEVSSRLPWGITPNEFARQIEVMVAKESDEAKQKHSPR